MPVFGHFEPAGQSMQSNRRPAGIPKDIRTVFLSILCKYTDCTFIVHVRTSCDTSVFSVRHVRAGRTRTGRTVSALAVVTHGAVETVRFACSFQIRVVSSVRASVLDAELRSVRAIITFRTLQGGRDRAGWNDKKTSYYVVFIR